jgi:hypothetical protein
MTTREAPRAAAPKAGAMGSASSSTFSAAGARPVALPDESAPRISTTFWPPPAAASLEGERLPAAVPPGAISSRSSAPRDVSSLSRVRSSRPEPEPTPSEARSLMPGAMAVCAEGSTRSTSSFWKTSRGNAADGAGKSEVRGECGIFFERHSAGGRSSGGGTVAGIGIDEAQARTRTA